MLSLISWPIVGLLSILLTGYSVGVQGSYIQPIGIDLSPHIITAYYAHGPDNVTELATFLPNDAYNIRMFQLRFESVTLKTTRPAGNRSIRERLDRLVASGLSKISRYLPLIGDFASPVSLILQRSFDGLEYVFHFVRRPTESNLDELTPEKLQAGFVVELSRVLEIASEKHDVDINFAMIAVPDFFRGNKTLGDLVLAACAEVGILTTRAVYPRTLMATVTSTNDFTNPKINHFVIDLGEYHCDFRVFSNPTESEEEPKTYHIPMDTAGTHGLDRDLTKRVINNSEDIQAAIYLGAKKSRVEQAVRRARILIRDNIDTEIMGVGVDEDHHHDEFPLELQGPEFMGINAVLTWEEVQAEENQYVWNLARGIRGFLANVREKNQGWQGDETLLERVDKVVILSTAFYGNLVKRAVRQVLGEDVQIVGDRVRDYNLAAVGMALKGLEAKEEFERLESSSEYRDNPLEWRQNHCEL